MKMPTQEDAFHHIIRCLSKEIQIPYTTYGYDLYLPNVVAGFFGPGTQPSSHQVQEASPAFMAAAWDLCLRGILRPGVRQTGLQATEDGAGNGFSVTP